jgi:Rrf2 family protein
MRIPMKVDYGVRALVELAQRGQGQTMQTSEIAARQGIPEAYLDQVLTALHKAGLILSRRGPQGGHTLASNPRDITLAMVMNVLEGRAPLLDCFLEPDECKLSSACAQREVWRSFEEAVQQLLSSTTIEDMATRQRELVAGRAALSV